MSGIVKCSNCGTLLGDDIQKCLKCGSSDKTFCLHLTDDIMMHEKIKGKVKEEGIKKPVKEFIYGDEKRVSKNDWVDKTRIIDREKNQYVEIVKDKTTQEIIHSCEEPLTDHFNHGSAKKKEQK